MSYIWVLAYSHPPPPSDPEEEVPESEYELSFAPSDLSVTVPVARKIGATAPAEASPSRWTALVRSSIGCCLLSLGATSMVTTTAAKTPPRESVRIAVTEGSKAATMPQT
jgi:hypothetical protein